MLFRSAGRGAVRVPSGASQDVWRGPTWSFKEIAEKLGITTNELNTIANQIVGEFPDALPGLKSTYGSSKYYSQKDIKRWVNSNNVKEIVKNMQQKQGVMEGDPEWNTRFDPHPARRQWVAVPNQFQGKLKPDGSKIGPDGDIDEDATKGRDIKRIPLIQKAKVAHPMAQSDEEALALYVNDREEADVKRLDREQDRELDMLKHVDSDEQAIKKKLDTLTQAISAINQKIQSLK